MSGQTVTPTSIRRAGIIPTTTQATGVRRTSTAIADACRRTTRHGVRRAQTTIMSNGTLAITVVIGAATGKFGFTQNR